MSRVHIRNTVHRFMNIHNLTDSDFRLGQTRKVVHMTPAFLSYETHMPTIAQANQSISIDVRIWAFFEITRTFLRRFLKGHPHASIMYKVSGQNS